MHERVEKRQTPLPTTDYFAAFEMDSEATIHSLLKKCSDWIKESHPDTGTYAGKISREEFDALVKSLQELRALSKDPDAFLRYKQNIFKQSAVGVTNTNEPLPPPHHREGDFYLGKIQIRPVRGGALLSGGPQFYKLVNPFTGDVMGSRAFTEFRQVASLLVGTYTVGLGRRETLVDRHTGEAYGQSFQRIFMKGEHLCGEAFGVTRHIVDPLIGTVSEYIVDVRA